MYRFLCGQLLLVTLLLTSLGTQAVQREWQNQEVQTPLSVQTRFEFPAHFLKGALIIQRYPPLCRNAKLGFDVGPGTFSPALIGQPVTVRFKVDDYPARHAQFTTYLQQRSDGPYLRFNLVKMERASTLLTELELGVNLNIVFAPEHPAHVMDIKLTGSSAALQAAVISCAQQAVRIENEEPHAIHQFEEFKQADQEPASTSD